jgi:hypothetical protein
MFGIRVHLGPAVFDSRHNIALSQR